MIDPPAPNDRMARQGARREPSLPRPGLGRPAEVETRPVRARLTDLRREVRRRIDSVDRRLYNELVVSVQDGVREILTDPKVIQEVTLKVLKDLYRQAPLESTERPTPTLDELRTFLTEKGRSAARTALIVGEVRRRLVEEDRALREELCEPLESWIQRGVSKRIADQDLAAEIAADTLADLWKKETPEPAQRPTLKELEEYLVATGEHAAVTRWRQNRAVSARVIPLDTYVRERQSERHSGKDLGQQPDIDPDGNLAAPPDHTEAQQLEFEEEQAAAVHQFIIDLREILGSVSKRKAKSKTLGEVDRALVFGLNVHLVSLGLQLEAEATAKQNDRHAEPPSPLSNEVVRLLVDDPDLPPNADDRIDLQIALIVWKDELSRPDLTRERREQICQSVRDALKYVRDKLKTEYPRRYQRDPWQVLGELAWILGHRPKGRKNS